MNGSWERVDLIGCISVEGQSLLDQVAALERGQLFSSAELRGVASTLAVSSAHDTPPRVGGDVRVAGRLLSQLVLQVDILRTGETERVGLRETLTSLARVGSNLLNPDLAPAWVGVVEGVEFDAADFLSSLEALARVIGQYFINESVALRDENLVIATQSLWSHDLSPGSHDPFMLSLNESTATVSLESGVPLSVATFGLFPTLGAFLPTRSSFNISHMTVATPILSVQAADAEGSEFTQVSVNLTLQYGGGPVLRPDLVGGALCASWSGR